MAAGSDILFSGTLSVFFQPVRVCQKAKQFVETGEHAPSGRSMLTPCATKRVRYDGEGVGGRMGVEFDYPNWLSRWY